MKMKLKLGELNKTSIKLRVPITQRVDLPKSDYNGPCGEREPSNVEIIENVIFYWHPKTQIREEYSRCIPDGSEYAEDITILDTDLPVNVAPSRISTYHSRKMIPALGNWSERLDTLLLQAFDQFPNNWQKISKVLGDKKDATEWRERYESLKHWRMQGHFTHEEDLLIQQSVEKFGKSWALIAKKFFKGRTARQIRDRYMKTLLKRNQKSTFKPYQPQFTIMEKVEEESDVTPREIDKRAVKISISSLNQEDEKRLHDTDSMWVNSPMIRDQPNRQMSDSSFFTDESIKDVMKGTDQSWYDNLDNKPTLDKKLLTKELMKQNQRQDSKEQYKNMMSVSSGNSSANVERFVSKVTEYIASPSKNSQGIVRNDTKTF